MSAKPPKYVQTALNHLRHDALCLSDDGSIEQRQRGRDLARAVEWIERLIAARPEA